MLLSLAVAETSQTLNPMLGAGFSAQLRSFYPIYNVGTIIFASFQGWNNIIHMKCFAHSESPKYQQSLSCVVTQQLELWPTAWTWSPWSPVFFPLWRNNIFSLELCNKKTHNPPLLLRALNAVYRKGVAHNASVVAISIRFSQGLCTYSKHVLFYNAEHKRLVL